MTESNSHPFLLQNEFQKLEKMFLPSEILTLLNIHFQKELFQVTGTMEI